MNSGRSGVILTWPIPAFQSASAATAPGASRARRRMAADRRAVYSMAFPHSGAGAGPLSSHGPPLTRIVHPEALWAGWLPAAPCGRPFPDLSRGHTRPRPRLHGQPSLVGAEDALP